MSILGGVIVMGVHCLVSIFDAGGTYVNSSIGWKLGGKINRCSDLPAVPEAGCSSMRLRAIASAMSASSFSSIHSFHASLVLSLSLFFA